MAHFHFLCNFLVCVSYLFVNHWFGPRELFIRRAAARARAVWTCNYTRHLASNDIDVDLRFVFFLHSLYTLDKRVAGHMHFSATSKRACRLTRAASLRIDRPRRTNELTKMRSYQKPSTRRCIKCLRASLSAGIKI